MKKFYFLAVMAMLAMSTTSCQKDDFSDAPVQTTTISYSTSTTPSASTSTPKASTVYYRVEINKVACTLTEGTDARAVAINAIRSYYKELLGSDVTMGATCGNYFRMRGESNEAEVVNKIKNTSTMDLDNALAKETKLINVDFTVYDNNNNVLFGHAYSMNYGQTASNPGQAN